MSRLVLLLCLALATTASGCGTIRKVLFRGMTNGSTIDRAQRTFEADRFDGISDEPIANVDDRD